MNLKVIQKNNLRNTCAYLDVNGKEMWRRRAQRCREVSSLVSQWKLGGSLGQKGRASYVSTGKNEERPNGDAGRVACLLPNGFYFLKELGGKVFWNFGRN